MGIYGESMSLINEGKITDKLEDMFFNMMNKVFVFLDKFNEKENTKKTSVDLVKIQDKANEEAYKLKYPGYYQYWEDKNIFEDLEKIFCRINKDSSDRYLKFIKDKFKTIDFGKIKEEFEKKYSEPKFSIKESDIYKLETDYREWYDEDDEKEIMKLNLSELKQYEKINFTEKGKKLNSKDNFVIAVNLQINLHNFLYSLMDDLETEYYNNYKEIYDRLKQETSIK